MLKNFWGFCKLVFSLIFLFSFIFLSAEENIAREKTTKVLDAETQASDTKKTEDKTSEKKVSEENVENDADENSKTDAGEKSHNEKTTQKEIEEEPLEKNFSTMSEDYVLLGNDGLWYYEKFDDNGNLLFARWYDKDKIVKEENYFYEDKRLQKMEKVFEGKKTFYFYDDKKNIVRIEEKLQDETVISLKTYNGKNQLVKIETDKADLKTVQKFFYKNDGRILREENYENGILISIIEYFGEKKRVHIFDNGKEIKVFDD